MRKKVIISLIYVSIVLTIPLAVACQGANDDSIDPILLEHVKSVIDFYPDCGKTLKVSQFDSRKTHVYSMWPKQSGFWFDTGQNGDELRLILPTNAMRYKDKYILFYLEGKKRLSEKEISRLLGISSQDDMPDSREIDQRIWIYVKDKESGKSAFEQIEYGTKIWEYPNLRYFNGGDKDSAVIDIAIYDISVHGEKGKSEKFSSPDKISLNMSVYNKSDSSLLIGLNPDLVSIATFPEIPHPFVKVMNTVKFRIQGELQKYRIQHGMATGESISHHIERAKPETPKKAPVLLHQPKADESVEKRMTPIKRSTFFSSQHESKTRKKVKGIVFRYQQGFTCAVRQAALMSDFL